MKKKNLKNLQLSKEKVTDLQANTAIKGGYTTVISVEPEFCNFTYNRWCYNTGSPGICTAPK
ncbi:hypothetical protein [Kordia jejudonensis]|uniref:hypothetical protein n=1 Tax=Kordia jejudonensis TaxID=1348245 RepID=UPI0006294E90|nr:hypothetical protein [Kordia jejudonensis]